MKPTATDGAGRPTGDRYEKVRQLARRERADYVLDPVPLDQGGQAEVFRARHKPSGTTVAFKRLREATPDDVARMRREIDAARDLDGHPHIMPVLDHSDGHEWLVMPLAAHNAAAAQHTLSDEQELRGLVTSVCAAMRQAHQSGWVHRDLKPANLLRYGGIWAVADWGLARRPRGLTSDSGRTRMGAPLGTVGFAAPELSYDAHGAGPESDVYSIGQIIGWAVTGQIPQANMPLIPPAGPWRQVVRAATQHRPELRPASIDEFLELVTEQLDYGPPYDTAAMDSLRAAADDGNRQAAARLFRIAARHTDDTGLYLKVLPAMTRAAVFAAIKADAVVAAEVTRVLGEHVRDTGLDGPGAARVAALLYGITSRAAGTHSLALFEDAVTVLLAWCETWPDSETQDDIRRCLLDLRGDVAAAAALALRERPGVAVRFAQLAENPRADERIRRAVRPAPRPLPAEGPALPAGARPHKGLPAELTSFVGREEELGTLTSTLRGARLVSVTGPGGVGKTRLALRAATNVSGTFRDGVCLADLSEVRDPELLTDQVASCLGLPPQPKGAQLATMLDFLASRRMLLILDTCEHIIDACATLAEVVIRHTAGVTILATTRQPLDVAGEHCLRLPPLAVPAPLVPQDGGDAVELFEQRASAATGDFLITQANRADVIKLCRHLEGMPLEIELAAARLRGLPLNLLVERLGNRFQVLSGSHSPVPRHRSMRDTVGWTYDLCTPDEQALWQRLSVFANTFDIDGAEAVCADDRLSRDVMVDVIAGLTDKSVVMQEGTHAAEYRMLDIYREFGLEQLAAAGGADVWRGRHLDRYAKLARRFEARFVFADGEALFHQLRADHLNIRSALDYALGEAPSPGGPSASDPSPSGPDQREARGTALAIALWAYWRSTGLLVEGRSWISKALEYCPYPSRERARALVARGNLAAMRGLVPDGLSDLREGIALAEQLAQQDVSAIGYLHLNLALTFAEYYDEATEASAEARRRFETLGVPAGLLSVEHMHALLETLSGNPERAVARCAAGLRAAADVDGSVVGNRVRGFLHLSKAFAHQMLGDVRRCRAHAREGLRMHHALGDWLGTVLSLEILCGVAVMSESYDWAAFLLGSSESQWRDTASVLAGATSFTDLHQQMQAATRSALGGRRFDEIYRAGAGTPLDDVVTFALTDFGLTNLSLTGFSLAGLGLTGDGA